MKLISVERFLIIQRKKDYSYEKEIPLEAPLHELLKIVKPMDGDEFLYETYELSIFQLENLLRIINIDISIDYENFLYLLDCQGNYEWSGSKKLT